MPAAKVVIADKGYDSDRIRHMIGKRDGTPVIPGKSNRKQLMLVDGITYALRNRIERCFNKLKCSRRLATRYDKTAASYLRFIHIAAGRLWVRSLSTRPRPETADIVDGAKWRYGFACFQLSEG